MKRPSQEGDSYRPGKGIYISCPGDMSAVVGLVQEVVTQIRHELPREEGWWIYHWSRSEEAYSSWKTYQDQIRNPSEPAFGVMLSFFGERVGMPLPKEFLSSKQPDLSSHPWLSTDQTPPEGQVPLTGTLFEYVSWPKDRKHCYIFFRGDKNYIEARNRTAKQRNFGFAFYKRKQANGDDVFGPGEEGAEKEYDQQIQWLDIFTRNVIHANGRPIEYFGERPHCGEQAALAGLRERLEKVLRGAMGAAQERVFEPKGLERYEVDDAGFFFGRDDEIRKIIDRLLKRSSDPNGMPVILLHGQNGEGKSSLLRAGILGGIKEGKLSQFGRACGVLLMPEDIHDGDPIIGLAYCIDRALADASDIGIALRKYVESERPNELMRLVREALNKRNLDSLVLCIDQAEDMIPPSEAQGSLNRPSRLWEAVEKLAGDRLASRRSAVVVIAVAEQHLEDFRAVAPALAKEQYRLGMPGNAAIEQIAEATLLAAVGEPQDAVSKKIAKEAIASRDKADKPGPVLPLLSLVLKEWMNERRSLYRQRLTSDEIRRLGSADGEGPKVPELAGIIELFGDRAWKAARYDRTLLSTLKFDALMGALTDWSRNAETGHIKVRLKSADADNPAFREAEPLLQALRDCRFIYAPSRGRWRFVNEIILTSWKQAETWRKNKRDFYRDIKKIDNFSPLQLTSNELSLISQLWVKHRDIFSQKYVIKIREYLLAYIAIAPKKFRRRSFVEAAKIGDEVYLKTWFSAIEKWPEDEQSTLFDGQDKGGAALAAAATRGNIEGLSWLLARPEISVWATDEDSRWNAIHYAAQFGRAKAVEILLQAAGVERVPATGIRYIDHPTPGGWTALHQAAYQGHEDVVDTLLNWGADARLETNEGWTALHSAAYNGHAAICGRLLAIDAPPELEARNLHGWTALHQASANGHLEVAENLIRFGAQLNAITEKGRTPLHMAAMNDRQEMVEMLLANGANVNFQADVLPNGTEGNKSAPLHSAASSASTAVVSCLISAGADVDCKTRKSLTPLHYAAIYGRWDIGAVLCASGAAVDAVTSRKQTPLMQAVQSRQRQFVAGLIGRGAKVSCADTMGWAALHSAAHVGDHPLVRMLLEAGADPNADESGETPLHRAVDSGSEACVRALIDKGADVNRPNGADDPWTPMHKACKKDLPNIVALLLKAGAQFDAVTKRGYSALDLAGPNTRPLVEAHGGRRGWSSLHLAAKAGISDYVARVLDLGVIDVNAADEKGATALHQVVQSGSRIEARLECMTLLISAGACTRSRTNKGLTPLHIAVKAGCEFLVRELARREEDVTICSNKKMTPLHTASLMGRTDIAQTLVDAHADPYDRSPGFSPIAIAMAFERWELLDILDPNDEADLASDRILNHDIDTVLGDPSVSLDSDVVEPEEFGLTEMTMTKVRNEVRIAIEQRRGAVPALESWLDIVSTAVSAAGGCPGEVVERLREGRAKLPSGEMGGLAQALA